MRLELYDKIFNRRTIIKSKITRLTIVAFIIIEGIGVLNDFTIPANEVSAALAKPVKKIKTDYSNYISTTGWRNKYCKRRNL